MSTAEKDSISDKNFGRQLWQIEAKRLELRILRRVVLDLRNYRKMIGVKKYD